MISGASGLIGSALVDALRTAGDEVTTLVRRPPKHPNEVMWSPGGAPLDPRALEGTDAVIVLGGASVGRLPWTYGYRKMLLHSRIDSTRTIVDAVRAMGPDAPALITASAVGYYGSAPGEVLTESAPPGDTFLAKVCVAWETEARRAEANTRVTLLRTAPVLERDGVLRPLILLTEFGVGGPIGHGTQVWPWISLEDEVRAIRHILDRELAGPVNLAGPTPATANGIGRAIARRMHRPFWLRAPEPALKLALSPSATESLLTADADVRPDALLESGFEFQHPTAAAAVAAALTPGR